MKPGSSIRNRRRRVALRHYPGDIYRAARRILSPQFGFIEEISPELGAIVPTDARVEKIAEGFAYTEGPIWLPDGHLLFGDLPNNVIRRWDPDGTVRIVKKRSGYSEADIPPGNAMGSNGMTLDSQARLTICEPGNRRVTRIEADGTVSVLADRFEGKRLNSPNDLLYKSDGSLYFTDPPHGLIREDHDPAKELEFNGIYRFADGALQLLTDQMRRPNGIAFSPDERYLYVSNSDPGNKIWMRYEVMPDGSISNGSVFLDLNGRRGQAPDGMKVDLSGNLYCTCPGGLCIVNAAGKILGFLRTKREPSNCCWGDAEGATLYMTAVDHLYRIRLNIPGVRP